MHLHAHVEELLALRLGEDNLRVAGDAKRLRLDRLAVHDERDVIAAGERERPRGSAAAAEAAEAAATTAAAPESNWIGCWRIARARLP